MADSFIFSQAWLIPLIPLFSFAIVGLFIRPLSEKLAGLIATAAIFLSAILAYWLTWEYFQLFPAGTTAPTIIPWSMEWLRYQQTLIINIGVLVDPTSLLLMVVVTTVSALVHLYSIGYLHGEEGYGRYFTWLNLFTFSMLGLVVAPNIMQMFVCWELVGVSSFLLIGYYYQTPSAVAASKKAFVVTRFADLGFLIGILILGYYGYYQFIELQTSGSPLLHELAKATGIPAQPFDFLFLNHPQVLAHLANQPPILGMSILTLAMILVFMGAAGKSAMFPLHIWLPDAMEGPTPVSALIHAATMVVAGVYLVARLFPAFATSESALLLIAYVGTFTCLFAAVIGCTQNDIKRVLAFSTLSQIGYMMLALGVATLEHPLGYTASLFHLFTHAFFKALLFLAAGAVIHAVHTNEIWQMGGLAKKMPVTHLTFLIAMLAIAGIPPFAGFFSKDEILLAALSNQHQGVFLIALIVAGLTAFYMGRLYFVTFWGPARHETAQHAHEAPLIMLIPLGILAVLSIIAGFFPMAHFVHIGTPLEHHPGINWSIAIPASTVGVIGLAIAAFLYTGQGEQRVTRLVEKLGTVYSLIKNKFYIDEGYLFVTHRIIFHYFSRPIAWFDRHVVDGGVNLSGWITRTSGQLLSYLQTGQVQTYAVWYLLSAVFVAGMLWKTLP